MKTPPGLQTLIDDGVIDEVLRSLKSGKEATVYLVRSGPHLRCAKVYRDMAPLEMRKEYLRLFERVMREIRRRTRVVGSFPDGESALMLVSARLRHVASTRWGTRMYMSMDRFNEAIEEEVLTTA